MNSAFLLGLANSIRHNCRRTTSTCIHTTGECEQNGTQIPRLSNSTGTICSSHWQVLRWNLQPGERFGTQLSILAKQLIISFPQLTSSRDCYGHVAKHRLTVAEEIVAGFRCQSKSLSKLGWVFLRVYHSPMAFTDIRVSQSRLRDGQPHLPRAGLKSTSCTLTDPIGQTKKLRTKF